MNAMQRIGEKVKAARVMAGMSQRDLAAEIGVSAMSISKWERGLVKLSSSHLLRVARATDRKVEYFVRPETVTIKRALWPVHNGPCEWDEL